LEPEQTLVDVYVAYSAEADIDQPDFIRAELGQLKPVAEETGDGVGADVPPAGPPKVASPVKVTNCIALLWVAPLLRMTPAPVKPEPCAATERGPTLKPLKSRVAPLEMPIVLLVEPNAEALAGLSVPPETMVGPE